MKTVSVAAFRGGGGRHLPHGKVNHGDPSIFHKCDETIRGHVFCSFLALVLTRELEIRMEQKGLAAEWAEVIRGLDNLQQVELSLSKAAAFCFAVNSRAMLLKPSALPKSPSRPFCRKSPKASRSPPEPDVVPTLLRALVSR